VDEVYVPAYFGEDTYWNRLSDGVQGDLPRMHEEFAEYCVAYIKLLERETRPADGKVGDGIHLYALSPQNEPAFGQRYASAVYSPAQYKAMLDVVGRRFKRERAHWLATINPDSPTYKPPDQRGALDFFPDVKIFGPEDVSDLTRIHRYLGAVLNDQETRDYLDIAAIHGYGDDGISAGGNAQLWQDTYRIVRRYNKPLWQTETSGYGPQWPGSKESLSSIALAESIHNGLVHGNVSAWLYWALSDDRGVQVRPYGSWFSRLHLLCIIAVLSVHQAWSNQARSLVVR
jgi:O-glycosyl hydrolase